MDGSGLFGTGIFGSGVDLTNLSTWSWAEYMTAGFGLYTVVSLVHTTSTGVRKVRSSKSKKAAQSGVNMGALILAAAGVGFVGYMLLNKTGTAQ
jgi:hypothetical protein